MSNACIFIHNKSASTVGYTASVAEPGKNVKFSLIQILLWICFEVVTLYHDQLDTLQL